MTILIKETFFKMAGFGLPNFGQLTEAFKKAHELSTTTMKERMNDLTGGLNLNVPGFDNSDS